MIIFFFSYLVNCINFTKRILPFSTATSLFLLPRICGVPGTVLSFSFLQHHKKDKTLNTK